VPGPLTTGRAPYDASGSSKPEGIAASAADAGLPLLMPAGCCVWQRAWQAAVPHRRDRPKMPRSPRCGGWRLGLPCATVPIARGFGVGGRHRGASHRTVDTVPAVTEEGVAGTGPLVVSRDDAGPSSSWSTTDRPGTRRLSPSVADDGRPGELHQVAAGVPVAEHPAVPSWRGGTRRSSGP